MSWPAFMQPTIIIITIIIFFSKGLSFPSSVRAHFHLARDGVHSLRPWKKVLHLHWQFWISESVELGQLLSGPVISANGWYKSEGEGQIIWEDRALWPFLHKFTGECEAHLSHLDSILSSGLDCLTHQQQEKEQKGNLQFLQVDRKGPPLYMRSRSYRPCFLPAARTASLGGKRISGALNADIVLLSSQRTEWRNESSSNGSVMRVKLLADMTSWHWRMKQAEWSQ